MHLLLLCPLLVRWEHFKRSLGAVKVITEWCIRTIESNNLHFVYRPSPVTQCKPVKSVGFLLTLELLKILQ